MIVPSLSTLFSQPALNKLGHERPALRAVLFNKLAYQIILLVSPRLFPQKLRFIIVRLGERLTILFLDHLFFLCFFNHWAEFVF